MYFRWRPEVQTISSVTEYSVLVLVYFFTGLSDVPVARGSVLFFIYGDIGKKKKNCHFFSQTVLRYFVRLVFHFFSPYFFLQP